MNCKKILIHCIRKNRQKNGLCFLAGIALAVLPPFVSLLLSNIAKRMEMVYDRKLLVTVILFLLLKLLQLIGELLSAYLQKNVQISCVADARITIYDLLTKLELRSVLGQSTGKLMNYMKLVEAYCNDALILGYQVINGCMGFVIHVFWFRRKREVPEWCICSQQYICVACTDGAYLQIGGVI